jgi:Phage portal protein
MPWHWPWTRHDRDLFQIGDIPIASTYAAVAVNPTTAMQHSAVWACTNLIAGSISTLPLAAYRRGERDPLPDLPPILRAPSAGWSLPEFLYATLQSLLIRGNAYGLIVDRAGAGLLPAQCELLAPERVQVAANGAVEYRVDGQLVDPASIWHVRAFMPRATCSAYPRSPMPSRPSGWVWSAPTCSPATRPTRARFGPAGSCAPRSGTGGPSAHPGHRRPAGRCRRMIHTRHFASSLAIRDNSDGRTLVGPLLPWGVPARVVDQGRLVTETFERGALAGTDPGRVPLTATHPRDAGTCPSAPPCPSTTAPMLPGASGTSRTP